MNNISKLNDMLSLHPNDCFLLHALGLEQIKIGQIGDAIVSFQKVLQVNTNYVGTYYHLAKSYETIQEIDNAIETYQKGIMIATQLKDMHAKNELQMALDDIEDEY